MSIRLVEAFAQNPNYSRVPDEYIERSRELVSLIQSQIYLERQQKSEEYYSWILELGKILKVN